MILPWGVSALLALCFAMATDGRTGYSPSAIDTAREVHHDRFI
jgi:hypothetical protein